MSSTGDAYEDQSPFSSDLEHDDLDASAAARTRALHTQRLQAEESSPEYEDRENRFEGLSSTWEYHTRHERGLIDSIQQQQANDLSAHLYNAHGLKARLRDPASASESKPWSSKSRWDEPNQDSTRPWQPDRHWVAWPLHPDDVPRREEMFGAPIPDPSDVATTFSKPELYTPSTDLHELLEALALKTAKEHFRSRDWTQGPNIADKVAVSPAAATSTTIERSRDGGEHGDGAPQSSSDGTDTHAEMVFLADDDQACATLQQPIRSIITKLDDLLLGLHQSRAGHRSLKASSRSRSRSRSQSVSRPESQSGKICSRDPDSENATDPDGLIGANKARPGSPGASTGEKHQSGAHLLADQGLRDWSEILGIASLVGWDHDVVDRAARRCASLFGESMAFRTMPETAAGASNDQIVDYVPDMISPISSMSEGDTGSPATETAAVLENLHEWHCPHADCARHHTAYEKGFRWREHLKKKHQYSRAEIDDIEQRTYPDRRGDMNMAKLPEYPCPVQDCKYHKKPFAVRFRWTDHLRRRHKYPEAKIDDADRALRRRSEAASRGTSTAMSSPRTDGGSPESESTDDEDLREEQMPSMIGGVHHDGFMASINAKLYQRGCSKKRKSPEHDGEQSVDDGRS